MKRLLGLVAVALIAIFAGTLNSADVSAQDQIFVDVRASAVATDVVNGRIVSTQSVELDGEAFRVSEIEVLSSLKGSLAGTIFVETPGGERSDGMIVYVSHTPRLEAGEMVQLALSSRTDLVGQQLAAAMGGSGNAYSVVHGTEGAYGLLPDGVGRASAVGDYTLTGASWPDFAPPVAFYVNPANSGVSSAGTIDGVRRAFDIWEDDVTSDIDFVYQGTSSKTGLNLNDDQNTVSWVNTGASWLAQASWIATGSGDITGFDVRVNRSYSWSNGAASGRYDIATVVAHEVGHGIGFGHAPSSSELMYFQIQGGTTKPLGPGDTSGAAFLYPAALKCAGLPVTVVMSLGQAPTNGDDVILGTNGSDTINAGGGNDVVCAGPGNDVVNGGSGNDRLYGEVGLDTLAGDNGDDVLVGGDNADELVGGPNNDQLFGGAGADLLIGSSGDDKAYGESGADRVYGGTGDDQLAGGTGNDKLYGEDGADRLYGQEDNDQLIGHDGDDALYGEAGDDLMFGGAGADLLIGSSGDDKAYGESGADRVYGGTGDDQLAGGTGNDKLYGEDGADRLYGQQDNDALYGHGGADSLYGEAGDDIMFGGASADLLVGGDGEDKAYGESGADRVYGGGDDDQLAGGTGNDKLYGEDGADRVYGQQGSDELQGNSGQDSLYGEDGADVLNGGLDADFCHGGPDIDSATQCEAFNSVP